MNRIGIECESIEDSQTWGIGRELSRVLREIASRPELEKEFKFFLYFKSKIPDYDFLNAPIFRIKLVRGWFFPDSFSFYYYVYLPIRLFFDGLNAVYFPNYMLPIIYLGKSLVALTDDVYYEAHSGKLPFRYRAAYLVFSNWAAKHATRLMTFSESARQAVSRLFKIPIEKIFANHHGIDIGFSHDPKSAICDSKFGLYVGQAFPRRHLKETLLAFEKITPRFPDLKFIAVAKDKYEPPIIYNLVQEINSRLGREAINYETYISNGELVALYKNARFVAYVSDQEAFGLPPIEALGYGSVPVVADSEVTRELIDESAFFVRNPITVETIAEAMREAMTNEVKRNKIKEIAPRIISRFSWSAHTDRFLDIIRLVAR